MHCCRVQINSLRTFFADENYEKMDYNTEKLVLLQVALKVLTSIVHKAKNHQINEAIEPSDIQELLDLLCSYLEGIVCDLNLFKGSFLF